MQSFVLSVRVRTSSYVYANHQNSETLSARCSYGSTDTVVPHVRRKQQRLRRRQNLLPQASTSFQVKFQSEQPYWVQPEKRFMYQRMTVVEFADDHDLKDIAGATALMLDATGSIHSLFREHTVLTGSYWDAGSILPPLIPEGPIGILGLGAGTTARIMHHFWPKAKMEGWELDGSIYPVARQYMGLQQLEDSGALVSHVGDALGEDAVVPGGFAGLVVDLFGDGRILPALREVEIWRQLGQRLRPGGRIIANISDDPFVAQAIIEAFPGAQGRMPVNESTRNRVALTGPAVDEKTWRAFPKELAHCTSGWKRLEDLTWE